MAVYVEYISRRQGIALDGFQQIAGNGQPGWAANYDVDKLILNVGRTWRLGPEPEYMAIWHTPARGLERLGEWAEIFESHEADHLELAFNAVGRIDTAGFYDPLLEPVPGRDSLYFGEFFSPSPDATATDIAEFFRDRSSRWADLTLNIAALRVGFLGPEPPGLAFWQLPSYQAVEAIAREFETTGELPIVIHQTGLYADIGKEIL